MPKRPEVERWSGVFWLACAACSGGVPPAQEPVDAPRADGSSTANEEPADQRVEPSVESRLPVVEKAPKPPEEARPVEPPPPPETARAPGSARPAGALGELFDAHNRHRARHCAPALEWSMEMASGAQSWAEDLAARGCAFEHSGTRLGENLAGATAGSLSGEAVADLWYSEHDQYGFRRPGYSPRSGHFTQVVWVASRRLGCGTSRCGGNDLWVCRYDPAGNMEGAFERNVLPTSCR